MQNGLFVLEGIEPLCNARYNCLKTETKESDSSIRTDVSPNPVLEELVVKTENSGIYQIFDLQGYERMSGTLEATSENRISVRDLQAGLYLIHIFQGQKNHSVHKWIKLN